MQTLNFPDGGGGGMAVIRLLPVNKHGESVAS